MINITIAGTTYNFPVSGESPNWGADATDVIVALADAINTLLSPGDILQTTFSIGNNVSVPSNVNGLIFDSSVVRAANITYVVYRTSDANPSGNVEQGLLKLVYDDDAPVNQKWKMVQDKNNEAGIVFYVSDGGQVSYTSTDIGSAGYSGTIKFSAKVLNV